ncbi:MAG: chromate transporter [Sphingomonas sp.]|uniref:chromate transporter n=1 Tax=Sphingomonas sp. TaxID=28214 RepID=UPI00260C47BD|nr:chromate transporter [Sphingomonas sp.]MDK2770251.1 chromate transporter [Sphingomonas sp.]
MRDVNLQIALIFLQLSFVAFGGGNTILPEIQRQVVSTHHWMTSEEFSALFALAQAAPGPNLMIVPLVGWKVAGLPGLLCASIAMIGPSSILTAFVMRTWDRFRDQPWRRTVQLGIAPVTAGLVMASAMVIARTSTPGIGLAAIAIGSACILTLTRIHPLFVLGAGAALGIAF